MIGIVGGVSFTSTIDYYNEICTRYNALKGFFCFVCFNLNLYIG